MELQKNKNIFAVVDCNNFYVSCERVFNPKLIGKPVIVLSNNDGCVISRSEEAKNIGVKMCDPFHKCSDLLSKKGGIAFSSNYALYGDMSRRVMSTLAEFSPELEVYSIDEAFLSLKDLSIPDYSSYCREMRETVLQNTGIPTSIGIASTKTLSKVADKLSKRPEYNGVLDFYSITDTEIDAFLKDLPVGYIWGIGRRLSVFLESKGIKTAKQLKDADTRWIRKNMSVIGLRTVLELRGISCIPFNSIRERQKGIMCTRQFGRYIGNIKEMEEAVTLYAERACEKLRKQNAIASYMTVFVNTNKHNKYSNQYYNSITIELPEPSSFTPYIVKWALRGLREIFRSGYQYKKSGVIFGGILPQDYRKRSLFDLSNGAKTLKELEVMQAIDTINNKYGRNTVYVASQGTKWDWKMRSEHRSVRYTTCWEEILKVKA